MGPESSQLKSVSPVISAPRTLWWQGKLAIALLASLSIVSVIILTVLIIWPAGSATAPPVVLHVTPITTPLSANSPITLENEKPGTTGWQLDPAALLNAIQGYAGQVSAQPGDKVPLYISTIAPVDYAISVYRIGWYGGKGGRLYAEQAHLHGLVQGYYTTLTGLVDCKTCYSDPQTHLLEPRWKPAYDLHIGKDWPSGVYLIKMVTATQGEGYIPLIVRADASHSAALVNLPVNTYQAYNLWGDYSAYGHHDKVTLPGKAVMVSFDRPYDRDVGVADFLSWDLLSIRWLERNGLDATYTTDVDLDARPQTLLGHRIFLDLGHDEYWSRSMRDGVAVAQARGVSMAFLGANDDYWQMRYAPNTSGQARHTFVCYKVSSTPNPDDLTTKLSYDPLYATQPELTTALWADPVLHQPAEQIIGLRYKDFFPNGSYLPAWKVSASSSDPLLVGTGLKTNSTVTHGLLGYEFDGVGAGKHATPFEPPANLTILATSSIKVGHMHNVANSAYFRAPSGAFVFDAGSIWWCWGLDSFSAQGAGYPNVLKGSAAISRLTANIVLTMLAATPVAPADV